ncbi:glycosyl transferase family 1 [Sphingobacterium sp. CZ-UAM]|nr:glycosyl transferase family 1 [Sphingobacterium sp. CZ-UAM]
MKIIYCLSSLYKAGGMERVVTNKANYLVNHGFEVGIITTDQKQRENYFDLDAAITCIDLGINYEDNNGKGLFQKIGSYPKKQRLHRRLLEEQLKQLRADIVISLFDHDASFLWKLNDGSHKFLEIHFSRFKRLQYGKKGVVGMVNRYRSRLDLAYASKYKRFIVLTEEDRGYWGNLKNIAVIPNANSFEPEKVSNVDQKMVIAVGRLEHQKRFEDLIRAWTQVMPDFPDWKLRIFGSGEQRDELQEMVTDLNLTDYISLCQPVRDVESAYLTSAIAVLTSRYEGMPMVLLEAQACGLPLVSYACKCGPKDIITDGQNGFLIAEGDHITLAQKLKVLMGDDALRRRMGKAAKAMSQRYSEDTVMRQWINLLNGVRN